MANLENLKPWPKGVSGNPNGRPPEPESWAAIVKRIGQESSPKEPTKTRKEKATEAAYEQAELGNYKAWAALAAREEGMPQQKLDHTTAGEKLPTPTTIGSDAITAIVAEAERKIKEEYLKTNK